MEGPTYRRIPYLQLDGLSRKADNSGAKFYACMLCGTLLNFPDELVQRTRLACPGIPYNNKFEHVIIFSLESVDSPLFLLFDVDELVLFLLLPSDVPEEPPP